MQFERIHENRCLQYFFNKYNIDNSIQRYQLFLEKNTVNIPEYDTLADYLYSLLSPYGITVWDIFDKAVEVNQFDPCENRKKAKIAAFNKFYNKNSNKDISKRGRKIRTILAPVGIDDANYEGYASSGSLSVNEYGQVPIEKLVNIGFNILAHPSELKLDCINIITNIVSGLELNIRSDKKLNERINEKAKNINLLVTKGPDTHSYLDSLYDDLDFYKMSKNELSQFVNYARQIIYHN